MGSFESKACGSPIHSNWSKDGKTLIVGNDQGTISLYGF